MRRSLKIFNRIGFLGLFILVFYTSRVHAEEMIEKRKVETRSYPLSSSDKISMSNEYGEMKLTTWDKQEIKIIITIISKAMNEKRADELIKSIMIESSKDANGVNCITRFMGNNNLQKNANKDEEYTINYEVFLPISNPLFVSNKFGLLIVPDYIGEATINSEHGTLKTGRISNAKEVSVEFGRGEIFHINNGHIIIRYSQAEINKLSGDIRATFEFADSIRISMDNDIKTMQIDNLYSKLYLDLAGSFSARFKINSQLNGVIIASALKIEEQAGSKKEKDPVNRQYVVTVGSGERKINVESKFGKVILGQYYSYQKKTTTTTTTVEKKKTEKTQKTSN